MNKFATALAILLLLAALAPAQTSYGSVVGTVTDATRGAIPNASVALINSGTGDRRTVTTDTAGNFQFVNLIPGLYRLQVENAGFKRYNRESVRVEVESAVRVDPIMEVGDVAEVLTVTAETSLLQTQTATLGQTVEGRVVQDMPLNGRNVLNLVALALVAFLPYPTELLGSYGDTRTATVFYALTVAAVGSMHGALWWHAMRADLIDPEVTDAYRRHSLARGIMLPALFLVSVPVAFVSVTAAQLVWWSTLFVRFIFRSRYGSIYDPYDEANPAPG